MGSIQWEWHTAVDVVGDYDGCFSQWGYKMLY